MDLQSFFSQAKGSMRDSFSAMVQRDLQDSILDKSTALLYGIEETIMDTSEEEVVHLWDRVDSLLPSDDVILGDYIVSVQALDQAIQTMEAAEDATLALGDVLIDARSTLSNVASTVNFTDLMDSFRSQIVNQAAAAAAWASVTTASAGDKIALFNSELQSRIGPLTEDLSGVIQPYVNVLAGSTDIQAIRAGLSGLFGDIGDDGFDPTLLAADYSEYSGVSPVTTLLKPVSAGVAVLTDPNSSFWKKLGSLWSMTKGTVRSVLSNVQQTLRTAFTTPDSIELFSATGDGSVEDMAVTGSWHYSWVNAPDAFTSFWSEKNGQWLTCDLGFATVGFKPTGYNVQTWDFNYQYYYVLRPVVIYPWRHLASGDNALDTWDHLHSWLLRKGWSDVLRPLQESPDPQWYATTEKVVAAGLMISQGLLLQTLGIDPVSVGAKAPNHYAFTLMLGTTDASTLTNAAFVDVLGSPVSPAAGGWIEVDGDGYISVKKLTMYGIIDHVFTALIEQISTVVMLPSDDPSTSFIPYTTDPQALKCEPSWRIKTDTEEAYEARLITSAALGLASHFAIRGVKKLRATRKRRKLMKRQLVAQTAANDRALSGTLTNADIRRLDKAQRKLAKVQGLSLNPLSAEQQSAGSSLVPALVRGTGSDVDLGELRELLSSINNNVDSNIELSNSIASLITGDTPRVK